MVRHHKTVKQRLVGLQKQIKRLIEYRISICYIKNKIKIPPKYETDVGTTESYNSSHLL